MLESELFALLERTSDATLVVSEDGEIQFWSKAAEHLFGYSPEEVRHASRMLTSCWPLSRRHRLRSITMTTPSAITVGRDPEDRWVAADDQAAIREKMLDKTLADSYPASDPPSTLPNPSMDSMCVARLQSPPVDRAA